MDINKLHQSKTLVAVVYGLGGILILLLVFRAGVFVGFKQGEFSHHAFGERGHMSGFRFSDDFPQTHGGIGKITAIKLPSLTIQTKDGSEKIVLVTASTTIRRLRSDIRPQDLKVGDLTIVLGIPDEEGVIDARFMRIMPGQSAPI